MIDVDGQRIGLDMGGVRAFSKYLSALILSIGFQIAWFDEKHQVLHE